MRDENECLICKHRLVATPDGLEALGEGTVHSFCYENLNKHRTQELRQNIE